MAPPVDGRAARASRRTLMLTGVALAALALAACAGRPTQPTSSAPAVGQGTTPSSSSAARPNQKIGKPYQVMGRWYYPADEPDYRAEGVASWYGPTFHGKYTANGEVYDQNALTAAHTTLPLPSIVRVTNLENGRVLIVRVNDRGPFVGDRVIDLSKRSAQLLGVIQKGTARVRLENVTEEYGLDYLPEADGVMLASLGAEATATPPATSPRGPVVATASIVEEQVEAVPAGEGFATPVPPPAGTRTAPGSDRTYVQVGAFREPENARALENRLLDYGHTVIAPADVDGQRFYRVRIGPFKASRDAEKVVARLSRDGYGRGSIVTD